MLGTSKEQPGGRGCGRGSKGVRAEGEVGEGRGSLASVPRSCLHRALSEKGWECRGAAHRICLWVR